MNAYKDFIVAPVGQRYNNVKRVDSKELILNTEIFNHEYINRKAIVLATPILFESPVKVGDEVIVHHNIFRRWTDVKGKERNSRSYWKENKYIISQDQIFLYKRYWEWKTPKGYCWVKPLKATDQFNIKQEKPLQGIVKYSDGTVNVNDIVGFTPNSEYEFVINGERLYRVFSKFITIKYEYQGDEEEYNPSWAQSG